jgi:magnesium-transporting ATPase (P-type)
VEGGVRVRTVVRVLQGVFLVAAAFFITALVLSALNYGFIAGLFGEKGFRVVNAVVVGVMVICSGVIASYEFWLNPTVDTERGEWTTRQLFYAVIFTLSFFMACFYIPSALFYSS